MMRKILVCLLIVCLLSVLLLPVSASAECSEDTQSEEEEFDVGKSLLIAFGAGLLIALIAVFVMYSQLKSVRKQHSASQYTKPGSMNLTNSSDIYLYRNVTRVAIQQNNSNSR